MMKTQLNQLAIGKTYYIILFSIFFVLITSVFFDANAVIQLEPKTLNPAGNRTMDLRIYTDLQRLDIENDEASIGTHWSIDMKGPFQAWVRISDSSTLDFNEDSDESGWYKISQDSDSPYTNIHPSVFPNLWPFEEYRVDVLLQIDDDVAITYREPISASFTSEMADNPDWRMEVNPHIVTKNDVEDQLLDWIRNDVVTIANFELIISHSEEYIIKNLVYVIISIIPIAVVFVHIFLLRHVSIGIHIPIFVGLLAVFLPVIIGIQQFLPPKLTLLEIGLISTVSIYVIFFIYVIKNRIKNTKDENKNDRLRQHISSILQQLEEFKKTNEGTVIDLGIIKPKNGILRVSELLEKFSGYRSFLSHLYTDPNNRIVYDVIYELRTIKNYFKEFNEERIHVEENEITSILSELKKKGSFKERGSILINSFNGILNVHDLKEFLKLHLISKTPPTIIIKQLHEKEKWYGIQLQDIRLGKLTQENASFLADELNNLTSKLLPSTLNFHVKLKQQHELHLELKNKINDILHEVNLIGEPLAGCCSICLKESFREHREISQYQKGLEKIPWAEFGLSS